MNRKKKKKRKRERELELFKWIENIESKILQSARSCAFFEVPEDISGQVKAES